MIADACPVCNEAYLRVSAGDVKWWDRPCRHKYAGPCEHAERLAISRAAEIERLKAALEQIAHGELSARHCADIARETLNETNQEK